MTRRPIESLDRSSNGRARPTTVKPDEERGEQLATAVNVATTPRPLTPTSVLALQRTVGNSATCELLARRAEPALTTTPVVQRTVDSAAAALHAAGIKKIKKSDLKGPFLKEHGVKGTEMDLIQNALDILRQNSAAGDLQDATRKKLALLLGDSSGVTITHGGVEVHLDNDQNKHQSPGVPIGTRTVSGGNLFKDLADPAWHRANTLIYMAEWAAAEVMVDGDNHPHGQMVAVNGIHYEGFCLMSGGKKYVSFHCYPSDGNKALKAPFKK